MGHWGLRMHANFEAVEASKVYFVSTQAYRPITHIKLLLWQAVAKKFQAYSFQSYSFLQT